MAVVERWPLAEVRPYFSLGVFHDSELVLLGLFYQVKSFTYLNKFSLCKQNCNSWKLIPNFTSPFLLTQGCERQKQYITLILHVHHTFWLTPSFWSVLVRHFRRCCMTWLSTTIFRETMSEQCWNSFRQRRRNVAALWCTGNPHCEPPRVTSKCDSVHSFLLLNLDTVLIVQSRENSAIFNESVELN